MTDLLDRIKVLERDRDHWREARRNCMDGAEFLKIEIERQKVVIQQLTTDLATTMAERDMLALELAKVRTGDFG